jgi:hypothetical protein
MASDTKLKCAFDYPTVCEEIVATVAVFTCAHGHEVLSGRCAKHGAGEIAGSPVRLICEPCAKGPDKHGNCLFTLSLRPAKTR